LGSLLGDRDLLASLLPSAFPSAPVAASASASWLAAPASAFGPRRRGCNGGGGSMTAHSDLSTPARVSRLAKTTEFFGRRRVEDLDRETPLPLAPGAPEPFASAPPRSRGSRCFSCWSVSIFLRICSAIILLRKSMLSSSSPCAKLQRRPRVQRPSFQ